MSRSRVVARNILAMMSTQLLSWVLTAAVMLYLPRYVSDVNLGRMALAESFSRVAEVFVVLGSSTVIVMEVAKRQRSPAEYILASLLMRIPAGLLMLVTCSIIARVLHYPADTRLYIIFACIAMLLRMIADAVGSVLRGQENIVRQSVSDLVGKMVLAVLTLALILARGPLWAIAAVCILSAMSSLVVVFSAFRKLEWPRPSREHLVLAKHLVTAGAPYLTMALFLTIYGQCGPIILHQVAGDAAVGWYGLARRLAGTAMFIPTVVTGAMLPTLIRLRQENPEAFPGAVRRMTNLMLLCVAPIAAALIFMPGRVLSLLHYSSGYEQALPPVFVVSGFGLAIWFVTQALGTAMIANEQQVQLSRGALGAVLLVVPSCLICSWLTTRFLHNGAIGATLADNLTEGYMLVYYLCALPRSMFARETLLYTVRITLATLCMGAVIWLCGHQFGLLAMAPALVVYAGLCWALRCIGTQDLAMLRSMLSRRAQAAA